MNRIRYVFPKTQNFREQSPDICWGHMYGWIDGYGLLFDPEILSLTKLIPEWENGWSGPAEDGDFTISCCHAVSKIIGEARSPGIYVRPPSAFNTESQHRCSEKEQLITPVGSYYYPSGLPFDRYTSGNSDWQLAGAAAVREQDGAVSVGFELFAMLWSFAGEWPERRLFEGVAMVERLMREAGVTANNEPPSKRVPKEVRLDFQAYGVNRLFLQWLLSQKGGAPQHLHRADAFVIEALADWQAGDAVSLRRHLQAAFEELTHLRESYSKLNAFLMEYPHMGILLDDVGFFELEWPEGARQTLQAYCDHIANNNYRTSIEAGASCWKNLAQRYPQLIERLKAIWRNGHIELTNGTYSLPYALLLPLSLQFWQFEWGHKIFMEVFERVPVTYQCQENSLSPQLPELLQYFGYQCALHIVHNRGQAPGEQTHFIRWQSPAGHAIPAMCQPYPALAQKGCNFFIDLPLVHEEFGGSDQTLNYVNFQDVSYIPFRVHMIRAHQYAPVWGRFATAAERLEADYSPESAPLRRYSADDYKISENAFYPDQTNVNPLSQNEIVLTLNNQLRQAQFCAWVTDRWDAATDTLNRAIPLICMLSAHDALIVQGQSRGEFHAAQTMINPPYSRDTLAAAIGQIAAQVEELIRSAHNGIHAGSDCQQLFNAEGVVLPFGRVQQDDHYAGPELLTIHDLPYAVGPFKPWAAQTHAGTSQSDIAGHSLPLKCGPWTVGTNGDGQLELSRDGQTVLVAPVDALYGRFRLIDATTSQRGGLHHLNLTWQGQGDFVQTVIADLVFTEPGSLAEIAIRYAPGRPFSAQTRWADYLALEVCFASPLRQAWRFNPNVRAATVEDQVASPYYLAAETDTGRGVSLLNEGALFYHLDRAGGKACWLFHVAGETRWQRRMAIAFDTLDVFQLSRGWSQGLVPLQRIVQAMPQLRNGWEGLSAEGFVEGNKLLVSNLWDGDASFVFDKIKTLAGCNLVGQSVVRMNDQGEAILELQPFELALLELGDV